MIQGGTKGDTEIYALALDSSNNLAVGGGSDDSDMVVASGGNETPFVTYYSSTMEVQWTKQFSTTYRRVVALKFDT